MQVLESLYQLHKGLNKLCGLISLDLLMWLKLSVINEPHTVKSTCVPMWDDKKPVCSSFKIDRAIPL